MVQIYKIGRILLNRKLIEIKQFARGGAVLDVGSGKKDYKWIFNTFDSYQTLEVDEKFKPDIIASVYNIPLAANTIDTIVCTQVLEHLERPLEAFTEFSRILKKNGIAIISAPFVNELHEEPIDYFRYTKYGLQKMAELSGFKIIRLEPTSGFFSLIAQIFIKYYWLRWINSPIKLFLFSFWSKIFGRFMIFLDLMDRGHVKEKFTIDWVMVIKKI